MKTSMNDMNHKAHELMREFMQQNHPKQLAEMLGVSLSTIYKWTEETESGRRSPLEFLELLVKAPGGERLLEYICEQAGGCFVRHDQLPTRLRQLTEQLTAEMERLLQVDAQNRKPAGKPDPTGGTHCRHRLPGGRCGFPTRKG